MFQRVGPKAFKKDLCNIIALCQILKSPQDQFPSIHIAGTNGKGSVAHMLAAVFTSAGYKTGLYTSPHYRDFRERIKINGQLISKKEVVDFVKKCELDFEKIKPSFFEWTVALAFDYFAQQEVDIAIIETGLGGRLDSTNIINPLLSVITNIGYDHTNFLGNTLPLIAFEKAGIIKEKVPVVIGETKAKTKTIFEKKAKKMNAPIYFADQIYEAKRKCIKENTAFYEIKKDGKLFYKKLQLEHLGEFQKKNLSTLLKSLDVFNKYYSDRFSNLGRSSLAGLSKLKSFTNYLGRWEYIHRNPDILVDSAHNEAGIQQAVKSLKSLKYNYLHIVLGLVFDKTPDKILSLLPREATYYFAKANIPRGMKAEELRQYASHFGLNGKSYTSVRKALSAAKLKAAKNDLIYVGGSIFVVAEVL